MIYQFHMEKCDWSECYNHGTISDIDTYNISGFISGGGQMLSRKFQEGANTNSRGATPY